MSFLVDTNVLVRIAAPADPRHLMARHAVEALERQGLYASSQNFIEFWNVATRPPESNGLGLTPSVADHALRDLELPTSSAMNCSGFAPLILQRPEPVELRRIGLPPLRGLVKNGDFSPGVAAPSSL